MRAQIPGLVMAYDEAGSGRPLLLVHGFPLRRQMWQPQLDALGDSARMIAPDLRGHGETPATPGPYSMDRLAEDCAALLDELDVRAPAVVAGLSMGGYVALALQRRIPERVAGLVLAATRAGPDSAEGKAGRDRMAALAREQGSHAVAASLLGKMLAPATYKTNPGLVERVRGLMAGTAPEGIVGAALGMRDRPDSLPLLGAVDCPVLILHGLDDQLIPPAEAEAMYERLPRPRLKLLPGAGHLLNLEQPEAFNAEVRIFLDEV